MNVVTAEPTGTFKEGISATPRTQNQVRTNPFRFLKGYSIISE